MTNGWFVIEQLEYQAKPGRLRRDVLYNSFVYTAYSIFSMLFHVVKYNTIMKYILFYYNTRARSSDRLNLRQTLFVYIYLCAYIYINSNER